MIYDKKLTGAYYFKKTFFGMIVMVKYTYKIYHDTPFGWSYTPITKWRKAKERDLLAIGLLKIGK